jgi:hypothetical protein
LCVCVGGWGWGGGQGSGLEVGKRRGEVGGGR